MRQQVSEALLDATEAGEEVTAMGGRVSLTIAELAGTHHTSVDDILQELMVHERRVSNFIESCSSSARDGAYHSKSLLERKFVARKCTWQRLIK